MTAARYAWLACVAAVALVAAGRPPSAVSPSTTAASWTFADGLGGWGQASPEGMQLELSVTDSGMLSARSRATAAGGDSWLSSPPFSVAVLPSAHLLLRVKYNAHVATGAVVLRMNGSDVQLPFQPPPPGRFHTLSIPLAATRNADAAPVTSLTRITLRPFVSAMGAPASLELHWVRVVHAPTLQRVAGCARQAAVSASSATSQTPAMPFQTAVRPLGTTADVYYGSIVAALRGQANASADATLLHAATYGCLPSGAGPDVVTVTGYHFGRALPRVFVGQAECTAVAWVTMESAVSCIVPPGSGLTVPVTVINSEFVALADSQRLLSYAPTGDAGPLVVLSNVAARSIDVSIVAASTWAAAITTGYALQWVPMERLVCVNSSDALDCPEALQRVSWPAWGTGGSIVLTNRTTTTIRGLHPGTAYRFRAAAITDDMRSAEWSVSDAHGVRVPPTPGTFAQGAWGPPSAHANTLLFDFAFTRFTANSTLDHGPAYANATVNALQWSGGEGHYGLVLVGDASVAGCNRTHSCCDGFGGAALLDVGWKGGNYDGVLSTKTTAAPAPPSLWLYDTHLQSYSPVADRARTLKRATAWATHGDESARVLFSDGLGYHPGSALFYDASGKRRAYPWRGWDDAGDVVFVPATVVAVINAARAANTSSVNATSKPLLQAIFEAPGGSTSAPATASQPLRDEHGRLLVPVDVPPTSQCESVCWFSSTATAIGTPPSAAAMLSTALTATSGFDMMVNYNATARLRGIAGSSGSVTGRHAPSYAPPVGVGASLALPAAAAVSLHNGQSIATVPPLLGRNKTNPTVPPPAVASGASAPCGPALRLTAAAPGQTGAAWYGRPQQVREGFDTSFVFRLANPSTTCRLLDGRYKYCAPGHGGGFAFVIHAGNVEAPDATTASGYAAVGAGGTHGLGYRGIPNALAIEFDTYRSTGETGGDHVDNAVSVHATLLSAAGAASGDGLSSHEAQSLGDTFTRIPDLATGIHVARVVYSPTLQPEQAAHPAFSSKQPPGAPFAPQKAVGSLTIYVDDLQSPALIVPLRLDAFVDLGATHGRAFVGFTASTGDAVWQTHDILSWHFTQLREPTPGQVGYGGGR